LLAPLLGTQAEPIARPAHHEDCEAKEANMLSLATVLFTPLLADLSGPNSSWAGWLFFVVPVAAVLIALVMWTVRMQSRRRT
jgi:hypothetical protein